MDKDILDRFIAESKLFNMLDTAGKASLAEVATEQIFAAGQTIMREGETSSAFYVLVSGEVDVTADNFGEEKHLAQLGAGAVFGEIAALTGEPRTATVTCKDPVNALHFERGPVMAVLKAYPKVLGLLNRIGLMRSEDTLEKMLEG